MYDERTPQSETISTSEGRAIYHPGTPQTTSRDLERDDGYEQRRDVPALHGSASTGFEIGRFGQLAGSTGKRVPVEVGCPGKGYVANG